MLPMTTFSQTKAFPTAEGYGKYVTGGRGGVVVAVTNLDDYNPSTDSPIEGSFRWALTTQGKDSTKNRFGQWEYFFNPITVVFKVGGVIGLKADFSLNRNNVTIAGQTALGEGVCFKDYTLKFGGNENVIVRFLKSRPGDATGAETSAARWENGKNFIFDHCSFSWGIEETTHFSSAENFTVQWCIISEGLYSSVHKKGDRGYGTQWGGQYATYHHNLLAHNQSRSPRINGANKNDVYALVDYRNNMNFNWGSSGACYGGEWEVPGCYGGYAHTNFVNSYNKPGPGTASSLYFAAPSYQRASPAVACGYGLWYFSGNIMEGNAEKTTDNWLGVNTGTVGGKDNIYSGTEFVQSDGVLEDYDSYTETAQEAYNSILTGVGAIYPKRDGIDARIIGEIKGEVEIKRSVYVQDDVTTPKRGVNTGIIDTPWNLKPEGAGDDWNPWASYYSVQEASLAPVDSDGDGIPDEWEIANGLNSEDPKDGNKVTKSGYTALEVYLNGLVGETIPLEFDDTSINKINAGSELQVSVYGDMLYLTADLDISGIDVFDLQGRIIASNNGINLQSMSLKALSSGAYVVKVRTANGKLYSTKFVK